jgi:hypothetical protein
MPNTAKKKSFSEDLASEPKTGADKGVEAGLETGMDMDVFDFGSLDDLATMMVDALTIPLAADLRDSGPVKGNRTEAAKTAACQPPSSKRIN